MKKICIATGTRAEYGLLYWLMKEIQNELKDVKNPYGEGGAAEKIKKVLKEKKMS